MINRYIFNPNKDYINAINRILKYLREINNYGLVYRGNLILINNYSDTDFAEDCPNIYRFILKYIFSLGSAVISWFFK